MTHVNKSTQSGMVSIMVTMMMMIVISLIVLGFAQVSRREQAEALDRQLSTQAFFAAESGVNDARNVIKTALSKGDPVPEKTTCGPDSNYTNAVANPDIDTTNQVSYTCLLVNSKVTNVKGDLPSNGKAMVQEIEPASGSVSSLHINWLAASQPTQPQVGAGCGGAIATYKTKGNWNCPYGVLRIDIVPADTLSRGSLDSGQKTVFLYPLTGVGTPGTPIGDGITAEMRCMAATNCQADITGLSGSTKYMLKLSALYQDGSFDISARNGGTDLELKNAQIQIDATGRARDVLRRIQVRIPYNTAASAPDNALVSGSSVCKHYQYDGTNYDVPGGFNAQDTKNPMCAPVTIKPPPCALGHDIILAVDTSESMTIDWGGITRREALKNTAKGFVDATNVGPVNEEGIIGFSGVNIGTGITYELPFSSDPFAVKDGIDNLPLVFGTDYYPPLERAEQVFLTGRPGIAKVLVFISDGEDPNGDRRRFYAAADRLKKSGVTVYMIGINDNNLAFNDLKVMASPGYFADAKDAAALQKIFQKIASEISC